jgi:tRNA nucleotidyltransferase (CCA-adding enzyme)
MADLRVFEVATEPAPLVSPGARLDEMRRVLRSTAEPMLLVGADHERVSGVIPRSAVIDYEVEPLRSDAKERLALRDHLDADSLALLRDVGRIAAQQSAGAFLVGGAVRDLLHRGLIRDIDVVLVGDALRVARALARKWNGRLRWHERFQTGTVDRSDGRHVDLARARTEVYSRPGALPRVAPAELPDDLGRRDFTVNAMAASLLPKRFGILVDPYGGRADLALRRIRVLHGLSYIEDPSRILRAVRFSATLDFDLEPNQTRMIGAAMRRGGLAELSAARLLRELRLMLGQCRISLAVRLAQRLRIWSSIEATLRPSPSTLRALDRLTAELVRREGLGQEVELWVAALGQVMADLTPRARRRVLDRLRPPRRPRRVLEGLEVEVERMLTELRGRRLAPSRIHRSCRAASAEALLLAAARMRSTRGREAVLDYLQRGRRIRTEITGRDLLRAGVPAGPRLAVGLEAALMAKLDGRAPSPAQQLAAALRAVDRA